MCAHFTDFQLYSSGNRSFVHQGEAFYFQLLALDLAVEVGGALDFSGWGMALLGRVGF